MYMDELEKQVAKGPDDAMSFVLETAKVDRLVEILATFATGTSGVLLVEMPDIVTSPKRLADPKAAFNQAIESGFSYDQGVLPTLPQTIQVNGKTLLVVNVSSSFQFHRADGGDSNDMETKQAVRSTRHLRHLMQTRAKLSFERRLASEARMGHLDVKRIQQYVTDNTARLKTDSVEEALVKRDCLVRDEQGYLFPTNAGLLLFGQDPERFIPSAEIIAVRYPGSQMSDTYVREDIRGSLPDQIRQAEAFVQQNLERAFHLQDLEWNECPALPLDVVHEIIVNAVTHRAYDIHGDSIRLFIFADRLECYSPGCLPGHVTVDNLLTERLSRNQVIGRVLTEMGLMERLGYGLDRVMHRMAEEGLPSPKFEETAAGFKVTLFRHPVAGADGQVTTSLIWKWRALGLVERQIKVMSFALENGRLTHTDYRQLCPDVSLETGRRDLDNLVERDLLLRVGDNGSTYFILK